MYNIIFYDINNILTTQLAINAWAKNSILGIQYVYASLGRDIKAKTLRFQTNSDMEAEEIVRRLHELKEADLTHLLLLSGD